MAQMQLGGESSGQSAWHHVSATVGGMGQQHAGPNGAIATKMTGGRRRRSQRQSKKQRQSRKQRRQSQSRRQGQRGQRGGRR